MSRGKMNAQCKAVITVKEDTVTKQAIVAQLNSLGAKATNRESLVNLKKKLAAQLNKGE